MVEVTWVANSGHPGDLVTKRKMPWSGAGSALDSEGDGGGDRCDRCDASVTRTRIGGAISAHRSCRSNVEPRMF